MVRTNENDYVRKWSGVTALTAKDTESNVLRAGRLPTNAVIDDNPDVEKITGTDSLGREINIGNNVRAFKPVLTLTYSGANLDLYALSRGRKIGREIFNTLILPKEQKVLKAIYAPSPEGKIGYGVVADSPTRASIVDTDLDVIPLVQQDFEDFNPATLNSFAIGANFARKFSSDLVAGQKLVHLNVPLPPKSARFVSEEELGPQQIQYIARSTNGTVSLVEIPSAKIDPSGSRLDPKAETIEIKFDLSGLGVCEPYTVYELDDELYCDK